MVSDSLNRCGFPREPSPLERVIFQKIYKWVFQRPQPGFVFPGLGSLGLGADLCLLFPEQVKALPSTVSEGCALGSPELAPQELRHGAVASLSYLAQTGNKLCVTGRVLRGLWMH